MSSYDKSIVVTGAASGIGQAVALRIASEEGTLVLLDCDEEGLANTKEQVDKLGAKSHSFVCDLSNEEDVIATSSKLIYALTVYRILSTRTASKLYFSG